MVSKKEKERKLKIGGITHNIRIKKENNKLIIYGKEHDYRKNIDYFEKIYSVENFETISGGLKDADSRKLLSYLQISTGHEKIYKSNSGKTICICRERLAEVTIDEMTDKAIVKISNGRTYELKAKKENDELILYDKILMESYNTSLKMSYSKENFKNTENIVQKFEDRDGMDHKLQSTANLKFLEEPTKYSRYLPPIVFSKDAKSVYIADYSGNLILWNWSKEPPLKEKGFETWGHSSIYYGISKTMLESRFVNQNLFQCNHINLCEVSGIKEDQFQALKRMGAVVERS